MSVTPYAINANGWTDCGASDDCTLQIPAGVAAVLFTVQLADPGVGAATGLRLASDPGEQRSATIQRAGQKVWVRAIGTTASVVVER